MRSASESRLMTPSAVLPAALLVLVLCCGLHADDRQKEAKVIPDRQITLTIKDKNHVAVDGMVVGAKKLKIVLAERKKKLLEKKIKINEVTIFLRGKRDVPIATIQEIIKICQDVGFEIFGLMTVSEVDERATGKNKTSDLKPSPSPIKIRLVADADGELANVEVDGKKLKGLDEIPAVLLRTMERNPDPEVEINADRKLQYKIVIQAITKISSVRGKDGKLVDKIKFASPEMSP